tara:strand:- start:605 stop:925 length:321 start_codon:yes stop_codon:yes gene_type:complete
MYKIRGKVIDFKTQIIENKKGGEDYQKMLVTIEESDSGFSNKHQFEIFGIEAIELHQNNIKIDKYVNIDFYIKSNEWKDKFFTTLNIKDIRIDSETSELVSQNLPF